MNEFTITVAMGVGAALLLSFLYSLIWLLLQSQVDRDAHRRYKETKSLLDDAQTKRRSRNGRR